MANRPFLKVRLPASAEAQQAMRVLRDWAAQRLMAGNLVKAVLLYNALLSGDGSLLTKYFPGFGLGTATSRPARPAWRDDAMPAVTLVEKSETDNLEDALSVLGGLELE